MKLWDVFYPDVLPVVGAGVPDPVVNRQLLRAAQDFCRLTRAWRVELEPVQTQAGVRSYDLELESQSELVRLERATLDGVELPLWRVGDADGVCCVYSPDGKVVELSCVPADGQWLRLTASLKPGNAATGVDDMLFDRYAETIARGAVARLAGDVLLQQAFEEECMRVQTDLWRGMAATRPRAQAHWF